MKTAKINRLKIVLVEQGEKQEMACRASNVSQPSLEMLMKIASILDIDIRRLINNGKDE